MKNKWIVLILWAFCIFTLQASIDITVDRLTTANGLSDNSIRCVYQDSKGFLWLGTVNGLSRYDGNSFINYFPDGADGMALADRRVKSVEEDKNGFLWVSFYSGLLSCMDLKTGRFVDFTGRGLYKKLYTQIQFIGNETWLYGKNEGIMRIVYKDGRFYSWTFSTKDHNIPTNNITFVQGKGNHQPVYIGTDKGLYCWKRGKLSCIVPNVGFSICTTVSHNQFLFVANDGSLWMENHESCQKVARGFLKTTARVSGVMNIGKKSFLFTTIGCFVFDMQTKNIRPFSASFTLPDTQVGEDNVGNYYVYDNKGRFFYINAKTGNVRELILMKRNRMPISSQIVYHVRKDQTGIVWIATSGNGLFAYFPKTGELQHFTDSHNLIPMYPNIWEDKTGGLWVTADYNGLLHLSVTSQGVLRLFPDGSQERNPLNMVRMLTKDTDNSIWVGTRGGGLYKYNSTAFLQEEAYQGDVAVYAFFRDKNGDVWKGTRGKGLFINGRQYCHNPADPSSLAEDNIYAILKDHKNRIWIGTFGGGLDLAIPGKNGYSFRHFLQEGYDQHWIRCLLIDKNGWMWVGTSGGLFVFNPDELVKAPNRYYGYTKENKALRTNEIHSLFLDSQKRVWIAESGAGMSVCTPEGDYSRLKFIHYDKNNGLLNNKVQAFAEDGHGHIWASTDYGVSCFDVVKKSFSNYFFSASMQGDVYQENCGISLPDGRIAFGSIDGFVIIDPTLVAKEQLVGSIVFTDLKLNGVSVNPEDTDSPLKETLPYTRDLSLAYDQNTFTIEFSTLDFSDLHKPKYSFFLEGYDKGWSVPATLNFATYKNLPPGDYTLHVKACNASGKWSEKEATLAIYVRSPFWATSTAYLLYIIIITAGLYATFRITQKFNTLHNKIKLEKQLTEYKLVFFTNISHEFRTPLTLIRAALEKLENIGRLPQNMAMPIKLMDRSTRRLLCLVNQLIEFRKMQNGKLSLTLEKMDVIAFVHNIFMDFEEIAKDKNIDYRFSSPRPSFSMFIDKEKVDKIVYNLISNALKFTPDGGRVKLQMDVNATSHQLSIAVTDSGVGIPKDKQAELFQRFMQTNFSTNSMGIGLHLTHELVKVHKGTIIYQNNPDGGSIFTVTLPLDENVYKNEDFLVADYHLSNTVSDKTVTSKEISLHELVGNASNNPPLNEQHILVIEDDKDIRKLIAEELRPYFHVETATDGNSGLKKASSFIPDLIICDVLMPGYSGFEVTKRLRSAFLTSHIPIILLTALSAPEKQLEGVECGADAYITKPFSMHFLLATVSNLIEQRQKLKEKFTQDLSVDAASVNITAQDKAFAERLQIIILKQIKNSYLSIDDLAGQMKIGRTTFYGKVKGVTGYSPAEFIRIIRLKEAAKLLTTSEMNVSEVAFQVGINDPFYFSRSFKKQFGVSPTAYKKGERKSI